MTTEPTRCSWCGDDPLYQAYHDEEWGRPQHDDRHLFEMLILEGAQAGLSWITILKRREGYRRVFHHFDPVRVAAMTDSELEQALQDPGIIRNRLKVASTRDNARAFLAMQAQHGSFSRWLWDHVAGQPVLRPAGLRQHLATSPLSDQISRELKKAGMRFVGSTIIYAYLQATGVVNDHAPGCYLYPGTANT
ncbi:DNA-3-methyladenine glycosylase I [Paludibacterium purpuratum]|uniref:DNA-3-methyladenine glycosylase I n=1 Tax=Paludibacterium purpuratum TaxID=1144873 RepID=A0A4R7B185_9NEIS|nr:DNA-3-methyladenine glycosylase I [Paludibacterium purpuratum]TDR73086.1 DNA-3-methyladenine glycosylase I [Paludibacterium purpuratum]